MTARLSRFVLTSHITFSVGWLGAVAVFLALAITGVNTGNNQLASAAYLAMELSAWFVIVPFCLASLITGIIQAVGTKWGLFKHYWIIVKLILTLGSTVLLLLHMNPISHLAGIAADGSLSASNLPGLRIQLIAQSGAALLVLLVITTISVYKPWGRVGVARKPVKEAQVKAPAVKRSPGFYLMAAIIILTLLFIILHLLGGGMGGH